MSPFTALESATLAEICRQYPEQATTLRSQIATATIIGRENSGAGFFTDLTVDPTFPAVATTARVIGNIEAIVEGFKYSLLLMLFMENGYAHMIEGAAIDDDTTAVDFSSVRFTLTPDLKPFDI